MKNLMTGEVVNWSYNQNLVRLKLGVASGSDSEQARDLMPEAAAATKRVLKEPQPSFRLMGFGDNAINL